MTFDLMSLSLRTVFARVRRLLCALRRLSVCVCRGRSRFVSRRAAVVCDCVVDECVFFVYIECALCVRLEVDGHGFVGHIVIGLGFCVSERHKTSSEWRG